MKKIFDLMLLASLSLLVMMGSCKSPQRDAVKGMEEASKAIAESNNVYFTAFVKGDSSIFIDRYAKDCCIMQPNGAALCGPDAALEFYRFAYYKLGLRNGKFFTTKIYGSGEEFVTEEGEYQSFDAANTMMDKGKYLVLWKKTPDGWKMFRDCFNSNQELSLR